MSTASKERRKFYRHPISAPLKLSLIKKRIKNSVQTLDISLGGLSFLWPQKLTKGSLVEIQIAVKQKLFEIKSKVMYIREDKKSGKFRTGVSFTDYPSAFMAKLAEEALEIIQYRKTMSAELGYEISEEEAAKRWVKEYGDSFPDILP